MKRDNPNRHKAFMRLREVENGGQETIVTRNGAEQIINSMKHFLLGKPYTNEELHKHTLRKVAKLAMGNEKFEALEKMQKQGASAPIEIETN